MNLFPGLRPFVWVLACVALLACDTIGLTPDPDEEDLPEPVILGFEDVEGMPVTMGAVGSSVVIVGESFGATTPGNIVLFSTSRAIVLGVDDEGTRITVTIPFLSFTGEVEVTVTVGSRTSEPEPFTVLAPQSVGVGDGPFGIASADFDGDGFRDLITANKYSDDLTLLLGRGDGTFTTGAVVPAGNGPFDVKVDDVDFDGRLDLVVLHKFDDTLRIFHGGDGLTFEEAWLFDCPGDPAGMVYEDFNADGYRDIVVVTAISHTVRIFLADGGGEFVPAGTIFLGLVGQPLSIDIADVDGDGNLDLIISQGIMIGPDDLWSFWGKITLLFGDGDGGISSRRGILTDTAAVSLMSADIDSDGFVDLVVPDIFSDTLRIYKGDGGGGFEWTSTLETFLLPYNVQAGDLNSDSTLDLVVISASGQVLVLLGDGGGTFSPTEVAMVGQLPFQFVVDDVNGDGHQDVATANCGSDDVSVLPGAANGRLASIMLLPVDETDPAGFAVRNHPLVIAAADFDGDGTLDLATANIYCIDGGCGQYPMEGSYANVSIFGGLGGGTFDVPAAFTVDDQTIPTTVLAKDLTDNGHADIVVSGVISDDIRIFEGAGDGRFSAFSVMELGRSPMIMKATDLNGDGLDDLVTANRDGGDVSVLLALGAGVFAPPDHYPAGVLPSGFTVGDYNGDNVPDIVASNEGSDSLSFFYGTGGGAFSPHQEVPIPQGDEGRSPFRVEEGDFNKDGIPDLAVLCREPNVLQILLLDGAAGFLETFEIELAYKPIDLRVLDVNHDSIPDVAAIHRGSNVISLFLGDGIGQVTLHAHFTAGIGPIQFAATDLTGDGCHDFAVANPFLGSITLLYGDCGGNLLIRPPGLGLGVIGAGE